MRNSTYQAAIERLRSPQMARDYYASLFKIKDTTRWQSTKEPCPFCGHDNKKAFRLNLSLGAFCCYACGQKGGSVIDFLIRLEGIDFKSAIAKLDSGIISPVSPADWSTIHAKDEADRHREEAEAAAKASYMWARGKEDASHPYLVKKRIGPNGTRVLGNALLVPMVDAQGKLVNVQRVFPDGGKFNLKGGRVKGCYFCIGDITKTILIAEGLGAAASLHEQTGQYTVVAFGSSNLLPIAVIIRATYANAQIIICADNDPAEKNHIGQRSANQAALACGGLISLPPEPGDWNDYFCHTNFQKADL